jgi:hypothetical protein
VGVRHHTGGNQQDRGGTREEEAARKSKLWLRRFDGLRNLGPHTAMGNLISSPVGGLVQSLAQQAFGFVLRFF